MIISAFSPASIWANSARTLTSMGATTLLKTQTTQSTLAAASNIDFRPPAGNIGEDTFAVVTGGAATGSTVIQLTDSVHFQQLAITAAAANSPAAFTSAQNATVGVRLLNNDGAVAALYMSAGWRLVQ